MDNWILNILCCFWICLVADKCLGDVEILQPFFPLYIKVGEPMEITCVSSDQDLEWARSTAETAWANTKIEPKVGDGWTIRTTVEQPTGFVQSVLKKEEVGINDRGNYYCRDVDNIHSFSIWMTTLVVSAKNVTAEKGQKEVTVECVLAGFDMNTPPVYHEWYIGKDVIWMQVRGKVKLNFRNLQNTQLVCKSCSSEVVQCDVRCEFVPYDSERHVVGVDDTDLKLNLTIKSPRKEDTGWYTCRFSVETSLDPYVLHVEHKVYIDASALPSAAQPAPSAVFNSLRGVVLLAVLKLLV